MYTGLLVLRLLTQQVLIRNIVSSTGNYLALAILDRVLDRVVDHAVDRVVA